MSCKCWRKTRVSNGIENVYCVFDVKNEKSEKFSEHNDISSIAGSDFNV